MFSFNPTEITIVYGTNNLNDNSGLKAVGYKKYIHPKYNFDDSAYDIGILQLKEAIRFFSVVNNKHKQYVVNGICLEDKDDVPNSAMIAGWGRIGNYKAVSSQLLKVRLPKYGLEKCKANYMKRNPETKSYIFDVLICYGGQGGKDTCSGDSGGPLITYKNGRAYLIGTVSFGVECAQKGFPGTYIQISKFKDWIKRIAEKVI